MIFPRRLPLLLALAGLLAAEAGCHSVSARPGGARSSPVSRRGHLKPVVAVMDFENLANFSGKWNLGEGMADLLVVALLDSDRVVVLERKHLGDVVGEIVRQGQSLFRQEGRVEKGRLMNAKYLIRGSVTDFTVTGDGSGWFGVPHLKVAGRGSRARVAITLKVSDVESGEIISSVKTDRTVGAGGVRGEVNYKNVAFGGDAYFRTPLGKATDKAIRVAVRQILRDLPVQRWQPQVAEAGFDTVIINGGSNVGLREGQIFMVRESGRDITDPVTGQVLEREAGRAIGRIRVVEVKPTSAHAVILEGKAARGNILEPVAIETR
jgi:curli biogenesis system outer membrane secretion channel CsgG